MTKRGDSGVPQTVWDVDPIEGLQHIGCNHDFSLIKLTFTNETAIPLWKKGDVITGGLKWGCALIEKGLKTPSTIIRRVEDYRQNRNEDLWEVEAFTSFVPLHELFEDLDLKVTSKYEGKKAFAKGQIAN